MVHGATIYRYTIQILIYPGRTDCEKWSYESYGMVFVIGVHSQISNSV